MRKLIFIFLISISTLPVLAQTYTAKVSKDSLGILTNRVEILKASIKLLELKIDESKEEADVEKLGLKLLEANGNAKASAEQTNNHSSKTAAGSSIDVKAMQKLSKKAKSDADDAEKALERFNKQISKVENIRTEIQSEERKLGYKKPVIVYTYL
ncbi:MAG: hypothetical protein EOO96_31500 [Pedobacter sp.]|nr:MAG: hypothetical protein EOO96_31500 [Pedobacter sp.]